MWEPQRLTSDAPFNLKFYFCLNGLKGCQPSAFLVWAWVLGHRSSILRSWRHLLHENIYESPRVNLCYFFKAILYSCRLREATLAQDPSPENSNASVLSQAIFDCGFLSYLQDRMENFQVCENYWRLCERLCFLTAFSQQKQSPHCRSNDF